MKNSGHKEEELTTVMGDPETGSHVNGSKRQYVESLSHQKKTLFQSWFQLLLLLCLVLFVLCYTLSSSYVPRWDGFALHEQYQRFFNQTHQVHLTTQPSTVPSTGIWYHQAHPRNYHFIMDNTEVCKTKNPFLVLMVPVAPHNVAARDAIRKTWANNSLVQGKVVLTLFMLGLPNRDNAEQLREKLKRENLQHNDLIQSDFMDTYRNLTIKTMVIMDWLATHCTTAAYAMKVDSDVFLNIDNLVTMLQKPDIPKQDYLTGMLLRNRPVVRSKNSKWYVPKEMYPDPIYPIYPQGMGYVFSNDLPEKFVEISKIIKPFYIEDAYIGMCLKKLGIPPTSPPEPSQFKYFSKYNRCKYSKTITYILRSAKQLVKYWTDVKKPGPPC